jgi:hypothetical protein
MARRLGDISTPNFTYELPEIGDKYAPIAALFHLFQFLEERPVGFNCRLKWGLPSSVPGRNPVDSSYHARPGPR